MKKLLTLLLIMVTTISFGQDLRIDQSIIDPAPYSVGDTITIKFNTLDVNSSVPTLVQFDYQYNVKLLEKIGHTFKLPNNTSAMTSLNHFDGYTWTPNSGISSANLSGQYQQGSYSVNADWAVERITIQDGNPIGHSQTILEVKFRVKDKLNTSYSNYNEVSVLNWANVRDNSTYTTYDVGTNNRQISLGTVGGGTLNGITFKLNTPIANKTQFKYTIQTSNGATQIATGNFDSAGEALISGLVNGTEYRMVTFIPSDMTDPQNPIHPSWLDDVVTISDAYLVFNYISSTDIDGNGTGTFDYYIQKQFSNIVQPQSAIVNDNDSYAFLSYLAGTLPVYNSQNPNTFFPITSTQYGSINYSMLSTKYGTEGITTDPNLFIPSPQTTLIQYSHGFNGDVNLSHSQTPSTSGYSTAGKNYRGNVKPSSFQKTPEISNLDITTELVGGKVIMKISTTKTGMAGAQFNLTYDSNILEFSEVVFDTGNTMTNFANSKNGKLFIGSLDLKGKETVKTGTPYKVIFTPKQTITNTIGLVSFGVKEGVKTDGTPVKFNIQ